MFQILGVLESDIGGGVVSGTWYKLLLTLSLIWFVVSWAVADFGVRMIAFPPRFFFNLTTECIPRWLVFWCKKHLLLNQFCNRSLDPRVVQSDDTMQNMVRILTLTRSCAQHFVDMVSVSSSIEVVHQQSLWPKAISCLVLLLIYERRFCKAAFRVANFMFVASPMTIVAICIVQPPLPPPTGDKWRPVSWSQFLLWKSQESKSTVDILLRG